MARCGENKDDGDTIPGTYHHFLKFVCLDWHGWTNVTSNIFTLYNCNLVYSVEVLQVFRNWMEISWSSWGMLGDGFFKHGTRPPTRPPKTHAKWLHREPKMQGCIKPAWNFIWYVNMIRNAFWSLDYAVTNHSGIKTWFKKTCFFRSIARKYPHHIFPFQEV